MALLKTYTISTDVTEGVVTAPVLHNEIEDSANVNSFEGIEVDGDSLHVYGASFSNETALNALVLAHGEVTLATYKSIKSDAIDTRSEEIISAGYTYAGKQFSLSANAQTNILAMHTIREDPAVTYPVTFNTIDDDDVYNVANSADMHGMFLTALGTKKAVLDSGTALKDSVRTATDKAGVDAVVDNR